MEEDSRSRLTKKLGESGGKRNKKVSLRNRVEENSKNTEKDKMNKTITGLTCLCDSCLRGQR